MAWRKQATHQEETKAVKQALKQAGIIAKVGHGRGTAWGWLEIGIESPTAPQHTHAQSELCNYSCEVLDWNRRMRSQVLAIVREVTGRSGQYDGETNVSFTHGTFTAQQTAQAVC